MNIQSLTVLICSACVGFSQATCCHLHLHSIGLGLKASDTDVGLAHWKLIFLRQALTQLILNRYSPLPPVFSFAEILSRILQLTLAFFDVQGQRERRWLS